MRPQERAVEAPFIVVYRNFFETAQECELVFDYSADERGMFFLDGEYIAGGPERGTIQTWYYQTVRCKVPAGKHVLTARVIVFGEKLCANAQMSIQPGLWIDEHSSLLGPWECQNLAGCSFSGSKCDWGSFAHLLTDEDFNYRALEGVGGVWEPVRYIDDSRNLVRGTLPEMLREEITSFRKDQEYILFDDYVCAYGDYTFSGHGEVRLRWAEIQMPDQLPADDDFRNMVKPGDVTPVFAGPGDRYYIDGECRIQDYWWHAGRCLEITLHGDVKIEKMRFFRTGYPWKFDREMIKTDDPRLARLLDFSWNTLKACTFETFMDCPYYEQLQYISDSRMDMLVFYEYSKDTALTRKALRQFAEGQFDNGLFSCRYPTKEFTHYEPQLGEYYTVHIPSFTAFYIQLLHDFAVRFPDDALTAELLPAARKAAKSLAGFIGKEDGVLHVPGWNFIDWLDNWEAGFPPDCRFGEGCTLNMIYLLSLKQLADIEKHLGSTADAKWAEDLAVQLEKAIRKCFYVEEKAMFAENPGRNYFSEHAQIFALLSMNDTSVIPALRTKTLDTCGIAFSFYYLEACRIFGMDDLFAWRLEKYLQTSDSHDRVTMPERFPNKVWLRSDCHAWGSHLLYHLASKRNILETLC